MKGWSASAPAKAQSFSVACAEGHRLQGLRTEGYQALRCPTCGEGIFVLPRSPLPEPPAPASSGRSRMAAAVVEDNYPDDEPIALTDPIPSSVLVEDDLGEPQAEIDWEDEAPPSKSVEAPETPARKPASKPAAAATPKATKPAHRPVVPVEERPTLAEWASRHRNALLVAAMVLLIVGTVAVRRRRHLLEEYPKVAELGLTEGIKKLDAGEFHAAKKLLGDAADAVDGLGGRFDGAEEIRQGAIEAAVFADLAPKGMDEILEDAATSEPKVWASQFAALYKGRSVIIEAPVVETPEPGRAGSAYRINFPLYFGRGPQVIGRGRLDLAGFRLFELSEPKVNEQKPFGARYASIEIDKSSNEWVVKFEPKSGVYITHVKALRAIDWAADEPLEEPGP